MQLFDAVKLSVTAEEAAARYANASLIKKGNRSWSCCPFHADKTPSMMFDEKGRFYCFSCNANGSAIDLVAQHFKIDPLEAAQMIAADYNLACDNEIPLQRPATKAKQHENKRDKLYTLICEAKQAARAYHVERTNKEGVKALDDDSVTDAILLESKADKEWLDILVYGTDDEAAALLVELEAAMGA